MSLTALQVEDRGPKYKPCSTYLEEALKTLNYDHTPRTIPRRYYKQVHTKKPSEWVKKSPNRGRVQNILGSKSPPDRVTVGSKATKLYTDGGIVGATTHHPEKGMVGTKVLKGGHRCVDEDENITKERMKIGKEFSSRKSSKNTQPLGKLRDYKTDNVLDHIPKLKAVDPSYEKEKNIRRILKSLNLNSSPHYKNPTHSSSKREPVIKNTTGIDFASSLIESHNLTLKQLREFWQDMPSFLNIQAAKLKRKYGIVESEAADDVDDIAIEIVTKWNKPTTVLPDINTQTSRRLYVVEEES